MPIETHPLQTTFRPGDTSLLRNKQGRCRKCDKAQVPGEKFWFCKGCNVAIYCSEECQRAHWEHHKPLCKYQQENTAFFESHPDVIAPTAPGMPNILELQSYLRDFTEIHRPSFQGLLHAKMLSMGGTKKVLTKENPQVCLIPLKYRPPGPEGEHRPRFLEAWEKSAASRAHVAATFANDPDFVDILPVLFAPHNGPAQFGYFPQYSALSGHEPALSREAVVAQLETYAKFIELGVVLRQPSNNAAPIPGYMQKLGEGKKWEWRPLWKNNWYGDPEWSKANTTKGRVQLLKRKLAEAQRDAY
ncbi:hypothetical protein LXA43DRAFT_1102550 [Ganoderma leucocontextum]|nr:hypothetical protein LXA43DRAFT_1102550 [Ganoderma leucocontextum]